jgi:hypothetical protein
LLINKAVPPDLNFQPLGKGVNYRNPYSVETPGYLISAPAEFTAGVKHG